MIVLQTQRLLLRDHRADDLDAFCAIETDPEIRKFVGGSPRTHQEAEARFRQRFLLSPNRHLGLWATVLRAHGTYLGYSGIYPHFRSGGGSEPGEGALAFTIARTYWGRGFASEAAAAWLHYGFSQLHLRRIVASVQVGNAPSIHILEKLGFRLSRLERLNGRFLYHLELHNPDPRALDTARPNSSLQPARFARG